MQARPNPDLRPPADWRRRNLMVDRPEAWAIAALASAVVLWQVPSRGAAALDAAPFGLALGYGCILAGRLVIGALRLPWDRFGDLPTVILVGFLGLNVLVLASALALPVPLAVSGLVVAAGVVGWAALKPPPADRPPSSASSSAVGLGCLVLSLAAATLWSLDAIEPAVAGRGTVVFRPWVDGYAHACFIRIFRDARGISSLEHFAIAGEPAPFYHYASFLIPGLLASTTRASCFLAFSTFMIPLGVALSGLAAFALGRWWWGPGAGLAAAAGVLLIPDASRYGIANPFLSYFWLVEIGPTWLYGTALMVVAWLLVFEGCRAGRLGLVAWGFAAAGLTVLFKAQLFFANALLIWLYPAPCFRGASRRARLGWFAFAVATFAASVRASGRFPDVPLLKLDGSGLKPYLTQVAFNLDDPAMKRLLAVGPGTTRAHDLLAGLLHLGLGTFGLLAPAVPILAVLLIRRGRGADRAVRAVRAEAALFPVLVMANYLIMALGLALDDRTHHMAEELLHRPLVWAYFAAAAWTLGCSYEVILKPTLARPGPARRAVPFALAALLGVPAYFGQGVQVGPGWGRGMTSIPLPAGFVRAAEFLRDRSGRSEVVQNSEPDRYVVLGALAERPVYASDAWKSAEQTDPRIVRRLGELARFRRLSDPAEITEFARRRRIAWYVLDPATRVDWPASIASRPAFEWGGFRVYRFPTSG